MNQDQVTQPAVPQALQQPVHEGDAFQTMIPTKNKYSLISYYMGIAGLLPFIGMPFSIAAVVLGVLGLKKYAVTPTPGAKVHAIIGLVLGILQLLTFVGFLGLVIFAN